eukprot:7049175-Pyramimonas_sp.AAC.1
MASPPAHTATHRETTCVGISTRTALQAGTPDCPQMRCAANREVCSAQVAVSIFVFCLSDAGCGRELHGPP